MKICRLRLWIELLKNAYYTKHSGYKHLETLPNIDINIKEGSSIVSRYKFDADLSKSLKGIKYTFDDYKRFVLEYKNAATKDQKRGLESVIEKIEGNFRTHIFFHSEEAKNSRKLKDELLNITNQLTLFKQGDKATKVIQERKKVLKMSCLLY